MPAPGYPFQLSIAVVLLDDHHRALLVKAPGQSLALPQEAVGVDEPLSSAVHQIIIDRSGWDGVTQGFIGSSKDVLQQRGALIEKTVLGHLLTAAREVGAPSDETSICWFSLPAAIEEVSLPDSQLLLRCQKRLLATAGA